MEMHHLTSGTGAAPVALLPTTVPAAGTTPDLLPAEDARAAAPIPLFADLEPALDPDAAFVAITRSGARHVVDPERGSYRRTHEGRTLEFPLYAVLGEVGVGHSLLVLVVADADRVVALHTSEVEYLAQLRPRPQLRAA